MAYATSEEDEDPRQGTNPAAVELGRQVRADRDSPVGLMSRGIRPESQTDPLPPIQLISSAGYVIGCITISALAVSWPLLTGVAKPVRWSHFATNFLSQLRVRTSLATGHQPPATRRPVGRLTGASGRGAHEFGLVADCRSQADGRRRFAGGGAIMLGDRAVGVG
jgi:hypothetical protein